MVPWPMFNPYIILGAVAFWLATVGGASFFSYERGKDDQAAYQTKVDLAQAQKDLADHKKNDVIANNAGRKFEDAKPRVVTQVQYRDHNIIIPPDADPFVPIWFVRMFNDIASV